VPDVVFTKIQFHVGRIFGRHDASAQLVDVIIIFTDGVIKSTDSSTVVVAEVFGQALAGRGLVAAASLQTSC